MKRFFVVFLALVAIGCGPSPVPADEVTESWTAGDDAPLDGAPEDDETDRAR